MSESHMPGYENWIPRNAYVELVKLGGNWQTQSIFNFDYPLSGYLLESSESDSDACTDVPYTKTSTTKPCIRITNDNGDFEYTFKEIEVTVWTGSLGSVCADLWKATLEPFASVDIPCDKNISGKDTVKVTAKDKHTGVIALLTSIEMP